MCADQFGGHHNILADVVPATRAAKRLASATRAMPPIEVRLCSVLTAE